MKKIFPYIIVILVIAAFYFLWRKPQVREPENQTSASFTPRDWIKGNPDGKVTVIEYSDFECPACGVYWPVVKKLAEDTPELKLIYRHFPLRQIHKNAEIASRAAEAAGLQGKFWEMHDLLFLRQTEWRGTGSARNLFVEFARTLNLDMEKFQNDLDAKAVRQRVEQDYESGVRLGVNGTPTFFVNYEKISNPRSYEEFAALIKNKIKQ